MSNTKTKIKRNAKASLFEAIFSRKEYLIQLYRVLHPEDTETTEDNLTDITLKNVLYNSQYNDLGFMVGNRLMVLVEAQSTWSRNIVARLLLYMADTWKQIIQSNRYLMYSDSIIELPKPEFYVVYTGQKEVPSKLLLSDIYYKGEKGMLEMEVQVRTLPSGQKPEEPNILDQYILFCQTFDRYRIKYPNDSEKSIKETLEYCEKEGILVSYLKEHRRKAIDTMDLLFDQKAFDKIWKEQNIAQWKAEGLAEGRAEGKALGLAEGKTLGLAEGKAESAREIALKLLALGKIEVQEISFITGLSIKELEKIRAN